VVYMSEDAARSFRLTWPDDPRKQERCSGTEGADEGISPIGPRNPEEDRILCTKECPERLVSSAPAHDGHAASQRRRRSDDHSGPLGAQPGDDNAALLPGRKSQGPARLLQGHEVGPAKDAVRNKKQDHSEERNVDLRTTAEASTNCLDRNR